MTDETTPHEFGIEVENLFGHDLDRGTPYSPVWCSRVSDALHELVLRRKVVVVRNLSSDPMALRELSRALSQRATGGRLTFELQLSLLHDKDRWYSDLSFLDRPPAIGVAGLLGTAHPLAHTRWIDTVRAYDCLPESLKGLTDDLRALHTGSDDGGRTTFQTTHPVVTVHPTTGRRALFLSASIRRLVGLSQADSDDLLDALRTHMAARLNRFTARWAVGDALIWDNAATLHDTLDGFGARGQVHAFGHSGALPRGIDGGYSRARHGNSEMLAAAAS